MVPFRARESLTEKLRDLARHDDEGAPVISLYLDARWDDTECREAARVFCRDKLRELRSLPRSRRGKASIELDARRIESLLAERLAPSAPRGGDGMAIFCSSERALWSVIESPRPFANQLVLRQVPYLMQLAEQAGGFDAAILCQVDSRSARVLEFVFGTLAESSTFTNQDLPRRHTQGGWSQMRYQRHVDWRRERHVREVAEAFVRLADRRPAARLLLSGPVDPLSSLRANLPKRILQRAPVEIGLEREASTDAAMRAVLRQMEIDELQEDVLRVELLFEEALATQMAVTGADGCCRAANQGAIAELLYLQGESLEGWRCRRCRTLGAGPPPGTCPACDGALARCDLLARLVEAVVGAGGAVIAIKRSTALEQAGGAAARLRYPL